MLKTERAGERPQTSDQGPHRQLTQKSPPAVWGELVARVCALDGVCEGHSQVSPASSRAVFLEGVEEERAPETNLAPGRRLEPVHLHGVTDTSVHLVLPHERGEELVALGWAEAHQYEDFGTEYMVYGPRDTTEVDAVVSVVEESIAFARGA
ncbi:luciferase family protein [Myceligenerans pegani]|uniref:luciferase domain-containing protein n=1 Tax=Myceligenerans pegani TaxID=2776917 RepID=UPI00299CDEFF|nr:luciferase family protein [Myceligenerans sp. TRM 65318]